MTPVKPPPVRKLGRRSKLDTPGRIALLDAAYRTFSRQGYEGTSLRDVASQADVDAALVARLFGSKAKLWEAVVERLAGFLEPHLLAINAIQTQTFPRNQITQHMAKQRMLDLIGVLARIGRQVPEFPAFVNPEMVDPGPRFEYLQQRIMSRLWRACEPIVTDAIHSGCVRMKHPFLLYFTVLQAISFSMLMPSLFWDLESEQMTPDEIESQLVALMASLVISDP